MGKACPTPVVKKSRNLSKKRENQKNRKVDGKKSGYEGVEKAGNGRIADGRVGNFFIKNSAKVRENLKKNKSRLFTEYNNIIFSELSSISRTKWVTLYGSSDKVKEYVRVHSTGVRKVLSIEKARVLKERSAKYSESARIWINASVTFVVTVTVVTIYCSFKKSTVLQMIKPGLIRYRLKRKSQENMSSLGPEIGLGRRLPPVRNFLTFQNGGS